MTHEAQDGNWFMWIMRTTSCLLVMIPGSKFSSLVTLSAKFVCLFLSLAGIVEEQQLPNSIFHLSFIL